MNSDRSLQQEKYKQIKRYLIDEYVLVHVATGYPGVKVPAHLASAAAVTLKLSTLFRGAISVEEDKITAELLFNSEYFTCEIPLGAIVGITTFHNETIRWSGVTPSPATLADPAPKAKNPPEADDSGTKRPMLRRVK